MNIGFSVDVIGQLVWYSATWNYLQNIEDDMIIPISLIIIPVIVMIRNSVFIIGCPRSGTSLLFNILAEIPDLWSIGYESKEIIEKYHHPSVKNWVSGELDASDVTETSKNYITSQFEMQAASGRFWSTVNIARDVMRQTGITRYIKARGKSDVHDAEFSSLLPQRGLNLIRSYVKVRNSIFHFIIPTHIRLLEKTPENCLRLPFLLKIFPDAKIIYLFRDGRSNISSLMEGWRQPYLFHGYKVPERIKIPGDIRGRWAFTLIPGWRELIDRPLEEVCAWQWVRCNQAVIDYFGKEKKGAPSLWLSYEQLIDEPAQVMGEILDFINVPHRYRSSIRTLPLINVVSTPETNKWRKNEESIDRVLHIIRPMMERLGYM